MTLDNQKHIFSREHLFKWECLVQKDNINLNRLMRLLRQSGLVADEEVSLTYEDCKLDVEDLEPHIPKDIYRHYFKRNQGIQW